MQTYFACPYKHFAQYILRLNKNETSEMNVLDIGTFLHKVAENFCIEFKKDENFNKIENLINDVKNSKDFKIKFEKASQTIQRGLFLEADRMCKAISYQIINSDFKPFALEQNICYPLKIDEMKINLVGKIDRIDNFGSFFRIIDYKSSDKKLSLDKIYYGENLQLFIYLKAYQNTSKLMPCGAFYFPIKNNFSENEGEYYLPYKLNGIMINDPEVVLSFDNRINLENPKSDIVNVAISTSKENLKDNKIVFKDSKNSIVTIKQFKQLMDYSIKIIKNAILEICEGFIEPKPQNKANSCKFCEYRAMCKFNDKLDENFQNIKNKIDIEMFKEHEE